MEKKKLLLVAISVGIFLVIAIGAAIVFAPKTVHAPSGTAVTRGGPTNITVPAPSSYPSPLPDAATPASENPEGSQPASVDAVDLVRKPGDVPGLKPAPEGTIRQGTDFYANGAAQTGPDRSAETVINVPRPTTAAVPNIPSERKPAAAPAVSKPVVPAAAPKPAAQAKPRTKPPAQSKIYNDYWVQTGAFSTIAAAEGVKETLASKGISSVIENRDMDGGQTLFRVRVGPYTSQNEADYWLSLIKTLDGFGNSQVRMTQTRR